MLRVSSIFRAAFAGEKVEEKLFYDVGGKDFQFVGIFYVHNLVADVVGCLDQVDQRVAAVAHSAVREYAACPVRRQCV